MGARAFWAAREKWWASASKLFRATDSDAALRVEQGELPYVLRCPFLADEERLLLDRLIDAIGQRTIICPKIHLSNALRIPEAHHRLGDAVRIDRKQIDFLICDATAQHLICAVQLDRCQGQPGRYQMRDEFLESALAAAGLTVLHVPSDHLPSAQQLRRIIDPLIEQQNHRGR